MVGAVSLLRGDKNGQIVSSHSRTPCAPILFCLTRCSFSSLCLSRISCLSHRHKKWLPRVDLGSRDKETNGGWACGITAHNQHQQTPNTTIRLSRARCGPCGEQKSVRICCARRLRHMRQPCRRRPPSDSSPEASQVVCVLGMQAALGPAAHPRGVLCPSGVGPGLLRALS